MRVLLNDHSLFSCSDEQTYRSLRRLFEYAADGRHWCDADDPDAISTSDFSSKMMVGYTDQELLARVLAQGIHAPQASSDSAVAIVVSSPSGARNGAELRVAAREVGEWASKPLTVLMENQSDETLLRLAVAVAPRTTADKVGNALRQKWIVAQGCGGTGELAKAAQGFPAHERVLVVFDSDRDEWGSAPERKPATICAECAIRHIPVHCLAGREKENYFPLGFLAGRLGATREHATPRTTRAKETLMYEKLAQIVDHDRAKWNKSFGRAAVDRVSATLRSKSAKTIPTRALRQQLADLTSQAEEGRMVDDLKARFGETFLCAVEEALNESIAQGAVDSGQFSRYQRDDLLALTALLERWL